MGCKYLTSSGFFVTDYVCELTKQSLDSYTVSNVCNGDYTRCIHFSKSNGGCYITTAVTENLGKDDDCEELMAMRSLRDDWLKVQPDGKKEIKEYYRIAPIICQAINEKPDREAIYKRIYEKYILKCLEFKKKDQPQLAYLTYKDMVNDLMKEFLG